MDLVFLDLEFVRYSKDYSFIVQIGAVKTDTYGNIISTFDKLIKPSKITKINRHFWELTKISKDAVLKSDSFNDVYLEFEKWLDITNIKAIITWGAEDLRILKNDLKRFRVKDSTILNKVYDYQDIFVLKDKEIKKLELMFEECSSVKAFKMHNALADAKALQHIFFNVEEDTVKNLILAKHYCPVKREIDSMERILRMISHNDIGKNVKMEKKKLLDNFYDNQMLSKKKWLKYKSNLEIDLMDAYIEAYKFYLISNGEDEKLKAEFCDLRECILKFNRKFSDDYKQLESLREKIDKLV